MRILKRFISAAVLLLVLAAALLICPAGVGAASVDTTPEVPITMPKTVLTVTLKSAPSKTVYIRGEAFDATGAALTVAYSDGSTEDKSVNPAWCRGFDSSAAGQITVNVSYPDGGSPVGFTVTVKAEKELQITRSPDKSVYYTGDSLSLAGLELKLVYTDSSSVSVGYGDCSVSGFDSSAAGEKTVSVAYHNLSAAFKVTVREPVINKIDITAQPRKTEYFTGEELDTSGIAVTATYDSGKTENITPLVTYSGFSSASAGRRTVTVSVTSGQTRFTDTFSVTVTALAVSSVRIGSLPVKTEYYDGEEFAGEGLILRATYNNGTEADIPYGDGIACEGFSSATTGEKTVKVRFSGLETEFKVTVSVSPDHVHQPGEFTLTKEPTCAAPGEMTAYCLVCGEAAATEPVEELPHTWGDWSIVTPPTSEAEGSESHTCTVCGYTEERAVPKLGQTLTCGGFTAAALGDYYYPSGTVFDASDIMNALTAAELAAFLSEAQGLAGGEPLAVYDIAFLNAAGEDFVPGCTVRYSAPLPRGAAIYKTVFLIKDGTVIPSVTENGCLVFESTLTGRFYLAGVLPPPETTAEVTQPAPESSSPPETTAAGDETTGGTAAPGTNAVTPPGDTGDASGDFTGAFGPILMTVGIVIAVGILLAGLYLFVIRRFY